MNNKRVIFVFIIFTFIIGLLSGLFIQKNFLTRKKMPLKVVHEDGFKYTSPLLYYDTPQSDSPFLQKLNSSLSKYINTATQNGLAKDVSVYIRFPALSDWTTINGDEKYSPASLLKVPLMMIYINRSEFRPYILSKEFKYDDPENADKKSNYKPAEEMEKNKSYTVNELIRRMIIYSDNNAENILSAQINQSNFDQIFKDIHLNRMDYNHQEDSMNVKTYSYFFTVLYSSTFLTRSASEQALKLLTETTFKKGIVAGVPNDVTVAHKFGERSYSNNNIKQLHDCGIVYFPNNPYILCVMTRGENFKNLEEVIKNISQITYDSTTQESINPNKSQN